ncbi:MAG: molybdopterin-dependent oxidoreductase, partial [Proteobacteria bacterium]|nr:molybdopterin-dependent oxidoreductase [Pseudomonadota bacterium]
MAVTTRKSYCRFCHAYCALQVDVEDGRVKAVRGDADDPIYGGYTCVKGRQLPEQTNHPERIRQSQKRVGEGRFEPIASEQALDEIAERVGAIVAEHGPRAVATYNGTHAFQNSVQLAVSKAWHQGLGSPSYYTSVTIDQPAKFISMARHGVWGGGGHSFESSDVALVVGNNPLVSVYSPYGGPSPFNPFKSLRDAQRRGLSLICVDPRKTELARRADLHLQVKPGEDPTLLAGLLRVILEEERHDADFCAEHTQGLEALRRAVAPFTPDYVARRTGVPEALVVEAARRFAAGPRGVATAGTGPDMAPHPNLTEHLVLCLNTVCGRVNREGEAVPNPSVLAPVSRRAEATPPWPAFGVGPRSRVRELGEIFGEMPTASLADEILTPGEGQVRALLCVGGNPAVAWPNQPKVLRALESLELFVTIDVRWSASAQRADYVLAPKVCLERPDATVLTDSWYSAPYAHYTEAAVEPEGDLIEEWELFTGLAQRLGTPIRLEGGELALDPKPSKHDVLEKALPRPRVPLETLRAKEGGAVWRDIAVQVGPPRERDGERPRLELAPEGIPEELGTVRAEPFAATGGGYGEDAERYSHRLISRRLLHVYNSSGRDLKALRARGTTNPAFMHPDDLTDLGLVDGDLVELRS